jgi:hypothetical protein
MVFLAVPFPAHKDVAKMFSGCDLQHGFKMHIVSDIVWGVVYEAEQEHYDA